MPNFTQISDYKHLWSEVGKLNPKPKGQHQIHVLLKEKQYLIPKRNSSLSRSLHNNKAKYSLVYCHTVKVSFKYVTSQSLMVGCICMTKQCMWRKSHERTFHTIDSFCDDVTGDEDSPHKGSVIWYSTSIATKVDIMTTCTFLWLSEIDHSFTFLHVVENQLIMIRIKSIQHDIDGLVQDCSISIANTLELLQSCTKPSIYNYLQLLRGLDMQLSTDYAVEYY